MLEYSTIVIMGVAGCGKSTIGRLLAMRLSMPNAEADSFHSAANVAKMTRGEPLDDLDREPWLASIADHIEMASTGGGLVISCSALKRSYRDRLRTGDPHAYFIHLDIDQNLVTRRVAARTDHFMPASLVDTQFRDLESLQPDEHGLTVDASQHPEQIVDAALADLHR